MKILSIILLLFSIAISDKYFVSYVYSSKMESDLGYGFAVIDTSEITPELLIKIKNDIAKAKKLDDVSILSIFNLKKDTIYIHDTVRVK